MDSADRVAATALAVGLVALVVALGQFLQQIFGTADGYRRCQESIIGPWAKRTRLVWRWSQFRFETKFTTPELVLYEEGIPIRMAVDLTGDKLPPELKETVSSLSKYEEASGDSVTWTLFLQQLYTLQKSGQSPQDEKIFAPPDASAYATPLPKPGDSVPSKIGVIYRERTWDLMPTDAIRPMASARLGAMVVLAHKLGMTWESTHPSDGDMRAEGNGHSLTSSMIRGLGIVFSYNLSLKTYGSPLSPAESLKSLAKKQFINSTASDKMLCGIIPGCQALGTPDLLFMGNRQTETSTLVYSAFTKCGVINRVAEKLSRRDVLDSFGTGRGWLQPESFPFHDLVALISPFMPVRGSLLTRIMWPMRTVSAISAFHFWECRIKLLETLEKRELAKDSHLMQVLTRFKHLETEFNDDFYCRRKKSLVRSNNPSQTEMKRDIIETLRTFHDWTTQYFHEKANMLPYLDLVGVHVALAYNSARSARPRVDHEEEIDLGALWFKIGASYVNNLQDQLVEVLLEKFKDSGDTGPSASLIEDAWWTLVLRGTVWYMSVHLIYPEYMLPSKLYYDQTPVFIM